MIAADKKSAAALLTPNGFSVQEMMDVLNDPHIEVHHHARKRDEVRRVHEQHRLHQKPSRLMEGSFLSRDPRSARSDRRCLLTVEGVTLQYRTREHLVTATYRVSFNVLQIRPLRDSRPLRLRQIDAAESRRRLHQTGRRRISLNGTPSHGTRPRPRLRVPGIRPASALEDGEGEHRRSR